MPNKEENKESKEDKIKQDEESELEEKIEETEEVIEDHQFHEFLEPSLESFTPTLEKIENIPQQTIDLEQDIGFDLGFREEKEDEKKYETQYIQEDYDNVTVSRKIINENLRAMQPAPIRIETVGRDLRPPIEQDFQINPELRESRGENSKRDYVAKASELKRTEIKLPFQEIEERKYKEKFR